METLIVIASSIDLLLEQAATLQFEPKPPYDNRLRRRPLGELGHGIHVASGSSPGGRDFQF